MNAPISDLVRRANKRMEEELVSVRRQLMRAANKDKYLQLRDREDQLMRALAPYREVY